MPVEWLHSCTINKRSPIVKFRFPGYSLAVFPASGSGTVSLLSLPPSLHYNSISHLLIFHSPCTYLFFCSSLLHISQAKNKLPLLLTCSDPLSCFVSIQFRNIQWLSTDFKTKFKLNMALKGLNYNCSSSHQCH